MFKSRLFYRTPGNKNMSLGTPVLSLKLDTVPDTLSPPLNLRFITINKVSKEYAFYFSKKLSLDKDIQNTF